MWLSGSGGANGTTLAVRSGEGVSLMTAISASMLDLCAVKPAARYG
jgi:hypothetical protein